MGISIPSKTRKLDIISAIMAHIEVAQNEALTMNATYTIPDSDVTFSGAVALFLISHEKRVKRYNPLFKRDKSGNVILTPKQRRRIHKKDRKQFYSEVANA